MTPWQIPCCRALLLVVLLCGLCACGAQHSPPPQAVTPLAQQVAHVVDLAHVVTQDMPQQHGDTAVQAVQMERDPSGNLAAVRLSPLAGTHLLLVGGAGAPISPTLETLSPRRLLLPAVVLDVRARAQDNGGYRLSAAEVRAWEAQHGEIPRGCMVLVATGWDMRWHDPPAYLNASAEGPPRVPQVGSEALALLFEERGAAGMGIDTPLTGDEQHAHAGSEPRLLLRNLTRVEQLPPRGATLAIGILKLQQSRASPASVLALLPET